MNKPACVAFTVLLTSAGLGGDLIVDKRHDSASDANAGTADAPFKTIQGAIDAVKAGSTDYSFDAGDTIWVKPGEYDEGGYVDGNGYTNRVWFSAKCRVVATGSKADTAIVGCLGDATDKFGPAAVRCVLVPAAGAGSILRGFTIRNGCPAVNSSAYLGGGINASAAAKNFYVADCTIRDCYAFRGGGVIGGTYVRCFFEKNNISEYAGAAGREANFWHCIFLDNSRNTNGSYLYNSVLVNCTTFDCKGYNGTCNENRTGAGTYNSLILNRDGMTDKVEALTTNTVTTASAGYYQVVSPVLRDFRLLSNSAAVGAASSNDLTRITFPQELGWTDFNGQPLPATETLNCGAVQEVVTPAAGRLIFNTACSVDGWPDSSGRTYLYASAFPTQYCVRGTTTLVSLSTDRLVLSPNSITGPFPGIDGAVRVMPPVAGETLTFSLNYPAQTIWVSAGADGSDDNAGTEAEPVKTLAKAGSLISKNWTLILVKPGTYDSGNNGSYRINLSPGSNYVSLRSTEGPEKTIIVGGDGIGCVRSEYLGHVGGVTMTGVTNAYVASSPQALFYVTDCIISNNSAATVLSGVLQRDRICGNTATAYVWNGHFASGTLFAGNTTPSGRVASGTTLYNCTFADESETGWIFSADKLVNTVVSGHGGTYHINRNPLSVGSYVHGLNVGVRLPAGASSSDPWLVTGGRPLSSSCVITGGARATDETMTNVLYRILASGGPDDPMLAYTADGRMTAGAYQRDFAVGAVIDADARGGMQVTGASPGENLIAAGESLTFTVSHVPGGTRICRGLLVNGVFVDFADYPDGWTHTVSSAATTVKVTPVYSTDIYAAPDGSDANDGLTAATPKTLQGAAQMAVAGDTLWLLPGFYTNGVMTVDGAKTGNRVILPAKVNLASTSGRADDTFIVGASTPEEERTADNGECGLGCVRCLTVGGENVISNVTLCGGRAWTEKFQKDGGLREYYAAIAGGASSVYAVGCVLSNNVADIGYVAENMTFIRCRILKNTAKWYKGLEGGSFYNCLVYDNTGSYPLHNPVRVVNCTLGPNWADDVRSYYVSGNICNSLLLSSSFSNLDKASFYRTYLPNLNLSTDRVALWADGSRTNAELTAVNLDATKTPVKGACEAMEAANADYLSLFPEQFAHEALVDFYGHPRILGGGMDIGAVEYDWRADFAADLGGHLQVPMASSNVVETAAKTVRLTDGQSLTVAPENAARAAVGRVFPVTIAGGTLTVTVNGTAVATLDAPGEWAYRNGAAGDLVVFSFAASQEGGFADLASTRSNSCLMLLVR